MSKATPQDLPIGVEMPDLGFESRQAEWGAMSVALETIKPHDYTEQFSHLPGGHCSVPHWGYVVSGRLRIKYTDHDETLVAGDAYYMAPGHVPIVEEDAVLVEFSPNGEYKRTTDAIDES